jgi:hypothetical protein
MLGYVEEKMVSDVEKDSFASSRFRTKLRVLQGVIIISH